MIDAIATDHAPHPPEAKDTPLPDAASGMLGLETALSVALGALCAPAGNGSAALSPADVVRLMSWRPARVAQMSLSQGGDQGGPITPGAPANLCVFDPSESWVVDPARMASRSRNTPWAGKRLEGRVRHTICGGEPVVIGSEAQR